MPGDAARCVVLAGAGHAHLYTLKRAAELSGRGLHVVLIAPDTFWYSGLATGMLGGRYPASLDQVDVGALVTKGGGEFVQDRITAIDPAHRLVHTRSGRTVAYAALSLNVGSEVAAEAVPGAAEHAWLVKPIRNLWRLRTELEARLPTPSCPLRIVVIGGGATGCEIAANVQWLLRHQSARVTIVAKSERLLHDAPARAGLTVQRILGRRGVQVRLASAVERVEGAHVVTTDRAQLPFDVLIDAAGLRPSPIVGTAGLPADADGALIVDAHLRSVADHRVFGVGDCAAFESHALPKIGVYAVRQAPVLFHNLIATFEGRPLQRFKPQRRYLLILNLGDGTGLATWGGWTWSGRLALMLKDYIDRRFLAEYQRAGGYVPASADGSSAAARDVSTKQ